MTNLKRALVAAGLFLGLAAGLPSHAAAATIFINNLDGPGEGFNDPTPAAPVGGNPGVTVGQQRLFVFQHAAAIWGGLLTSAVPIIVDARFDPLTCTATAAVLGSAGANSAFRDYPGAEFSGTWYHVALANRRAGFDLDGGSLNDITARFNSALNGSPACLGGRGWYYGFDGIEGANVELLPVVLHELGHGLGFATFVSKTTGAELVGFPDIYEHYIRDNNLGLRWTSLTNAQRVANIISGNAQVWDGPEVFSRAPSFLGPRQIVRVTAPAAISGLLTFGTAAFGAVVGASNVSGELVLVDDGVAPLSDGCTAIVNSIAGKIALIDRGTCTFVSKAATAQAAGAIAVVIANNVAGPPPGMAGVDPTITIPVVSVSQADGVALKANLPGVMITIGSDPTLLAGADNAGRPLLYAPNPVQTGSSTSHWDVSASPDLLMEPAINTSLSSSVDLTLPHFVDIGWFPNQDPDCSGAVALMENIWPPNHLLVPVTITGVLDPDGDPVAITVTAITQDEILNGIGDGNTCPDGAIVNGGAQVRSERSGTGNGRVYLVTFVAADDRGGSCEGTVKVVVAHDEGGAAGAVDDGQNYNSLGPCKGRIATEEEVALGTLDLRLVSMRSGTAVLEYTLPADGEMSLNVYDVAGRKVGAVDGGLRTAGAHRVSFTPEGRGRGVYFYRLRTPAGTLTRSVVHLD